MVFAGHVFVPATLLRYVAPWEQVARPPWNPLMYDSVGQFFPWRHFAAQEIQSGRIPLWNPYQFCGTPFAANSQSAVFYPGNLLYWLLPTAVAAGLNAILHLCLAGWFTVRFLRSLGLGGRAALLGGIVYSLSGWQVSWLALPTFLCTSCWLPVALLSVRRLYEAPRLRRAAELGAVIGMVLLAGHLQIAFYVLLTTALYAVWMALTGASGSSPYRRAPFLLCALSGLGLGAMLAAPQLLPSMELSRRSHRVGPVTSAGFEQYAAYAANPASAVSLFLPDYYGNPSDPRVPYVGASRGGLYFNYAEGAMYVGIPTLLLAAFALFRIKQVGPARVGFFALLALLSAMLATGTFVDALLYFYVPGFGQSGSPGRSLVLWAFALSCLAAFGFEKLLNDDATPVKSAAAAFVAVALACGVAIALAPGAVMRGAENPGALSQMPKQAALFVLTAGAALALASGRLRGSRYAGLPVFLTAVDLVSAGAGYNLTAPPQDVYPARPSLSLIRQLAGHDRIMPVNRGWSFAGPAAVLPPNGAMVLGLRDIQGYDSLFPGQYKEFMNRLSGRDASPPEVGNMVFAKKPDSSLAAPAGVRYVLSREELPLPGRVDTGEGYLRFDLPGAAGRATAIAQGARPARVDWLEDEPTRVSLRVDSGSPSTLKLADQRYPGWRAVVDTSPAIIQPDNGVFRSVEVPAGRHVVRFIYEPSSYRVGLYIACLAAALTAAAAARRSHRS